MQKEWFTEWFDSPYYHTLYKSHDETEAKAAIDKLLTALQLPSDSRILDLACGKGRHSRYLAEKGFDVTGLDISAASIVFAKQYEHERLLFFQHDMRLPYRMNYFDAILNMFTSFGYFISDSEHLKALKNASKGLRPKGLFLLDFFNSTYVIKQVVRSETKTIDNIEFHLKKTVRGGHIYKTVEFSTGGRDFVFRERVRLFQLEDFKSLFDAAGMELIQTYGGYDLRPFDPLTSKRLVMVAQKKD
jgi:SAM-dependent methyltransferase